MPANPVDWREFPYAPFLNPLPAPAHDPDEEPTICIQITRNYVPYIIGALRTLIYSDVFEGDQAATDLAARRFENLIVMFEVATNECAPCGDNCNDCDCNDCNDCEEC